VALVAAVVDLDPADVGAGPLAHQGQVVVGGDEGGPGDVVHAAFVAVAAQRPRGGGAVGPGHERVTAVAEVRGPPAVAGIAAGEVSTQVGVQGVTQDRPGHPDRSEVGLTVKVAGGGRERVAPHRVLHGRVHDAPDPGPRRRLERRPMRTCRVWRAERADHQKPIHALKRRFQRLGPLEVPEPRPLVELGPGYRHQRLRGHPTLEQRIDHQASEPPRRPRHRNNHARKPSPRPPVTTVTGREE
jgi:hypothetical protein